MKNSQKNFILITTLVVSIISALTGIIAMYIGYKSDSKTEQYREEERLKDLFRIKLNVFQKTRDLFIQKNAMVRLNKKRIAEINEFASNVCSGLSSNGIDALLLSSELHNKEEYKNFESVCLQIFDEIKVFSNKYFSKSLNEKLDKIKDFEWWETKYDWLRASILSNMEEEIERLSLLY